MPDPSSSAHIFDDGFGTTTVTTFRGRPLPTAAFLAGYSALIGGFNLDVPLPHTLSGISPRNTRRREENWAIYPDASWPGSRPVDHLVFALKYEGIDLLVLKKVFGAMDARDLVEAIAARPTSAYLRRICFFYEWLTERRLPVADTVAGAYANAVDTSLQYGTATPANDRRFRVRNNLPGTAAFCPLVHRTRALERYIESDIASRARQVVASAPRELIARAAAFLLLSDSKASFAIEGERPPRDRIARWGTVIGQAGKLGLTIDRLVQLQRELIGDDRFVRIGLRQEGGFVGRHDAFGQPEPEHISARAPDLAALLNGLFAFETVSSRSGYDPVLTAASLSFGFVYIHPFEDGNGRIHRFLVHHVLASRGFTPPEIVFPIASVILDDIARYKDVLEATSRPLLGVIDWAATGTGNVDVPGDTADLYRFFDATAHSEYLFKCLARAVDKDLPEELAFLDHRDAFHRQVTRIVDMGERKLDLLLRFLQQNHGSLSRRARAREFAGLSDGEAEAIEEVFRAAFQA